MCNTYIHICDMQYTYKKYVYIFLYAYTQYTHAYCICIYVRQSGLQCMREVVSGIVALISSSTPKPEIPGWCTSLWHSWRISTEDHHRLSRMAVTPSWLLGGSKLLKWVLCTDSSYRPSFGTRSATNSISPPLPSSLTAACAKISIQIPAIAIPVPSCPRTKESSQSIIMLKVEEGWGWTFPNTTQLRILHTGD